jgi:hypothetical protein
MDVVTPDQVRIAEEAGVCAIMAIERVPADIRAQGGVARMSDLGLICNIKRAKAHIGHFVETQIRMPSASTTWTRARRSPSPTTPTTSTSISSTTR